MMQSTFSLIENINAKGVITEREILLLKKRINNGDALENMASSYKLTEEQNEKGKNWILTRLAKKDGKSRNGYEDFNELIELAKDKKSYFTLDDFIDIGRRNSFYVPIYTLHNDTSYFSYYVNGSSPVAY